MESVAAERLNKLGKNPSIISTRHDLKRDAAVLKDIINRATPQPSSEDCSSSEEEKQTNSSSSSSNENIKYSLTHLHDQLENCNKKRRRKRRRSSSSSKKFKKLSRLFLAAPSSTLNSTLDEHKNRLRKSPSTPWSLFRKRGSTTPSLSNQPSA